MTSDEIRKSCLVVIRCCEVLLERPETTTVEKIEIMKIMGGILSNLHSLNYWEEKLERKRKKKEKKLENSIKQGVDQSHRLESETTS